MKRATQQTFVVFTAALLLAPLATLNAVDLPKPQAKPNISLANDKLPVALVNYSNLPVYVAAITLDEQLFRWPVRVRRADNAAKLPLVRGVEDGRPVVRLFVSLPPSSRLDLVAERWSESRMVEAKAAMANRAVIRCHGGALG
jgi:hypothetical protein